MTQYYTVYWLFSWARAENVFMAQVAESAPLVGQGAWFRLWLYVGYGALLAPLAAPALGWIAWRWQRLEWAPWCLALLVFGVMAAAQMRFAELVVVPLALSIAALCAASSPRLALRIPAWGTVAEAVIAGLGLHWIGVRSTVQRAMTERPFTDSLAKRSARVMSDWLRSHSAPRSGVMAVWSHGQLIQWAAERPVVEVPRRTHRAVHGPNPARRYRTTEEASAAILKLKKAATQ